MVTLYDVARQAGVSIATVSRVLHGQEPVRESTRDRVRAAIKELGYVPDGAAQSLARSRKDVIGLVCVEHTGLNPNQYDIESMSLLFYDEVMRGVEALIRERHWSLLITYLREDENPGVAPQEDEPVLPRLQALSGKVDGLLIGEGVVPATALARLARRLPVVVVAGDAGHARRRRGGGRQLVGRARAGPPPAVDHGRRRLYHVDGPPSAPDAKTRRLAMQAVIDAQPGARLVGAHSGRFSVRERRGRGRADAGRLRRRRTASCPTRSSARTTRWRSACCARWRRAGSGCRTTSRWSVLMTSTPRHLCDPPLTTVRQPIRGIGERACERLIERIANPTLRPAVELLPDRARHPVQLRLPARHGGAQAGGDRRPNGLPMRHQRPAASRTTAAGHQNQDPTNDPTKRKVGGRACRIYSAASPSTW